jgi:glutaredoxin
MEAYCNAVRALEDKFYSIELNHVPRKYNEEADELAKIASGRITVPQMFLRETSRNRPSTSDRHPRARRNPRGLPRTQRARSPWTWTPLTRHLCSPCSRATVQMRPRPWRQSQPPRGGLAGKIPRLGGSRGTSPGSVRGQAHHQDGQVVHHH